MSDNINTMTHDEQVALGVEIVDGFLERARGASSEIVMAAVCALTKYTLCEIAADREVLEIVLNRIKKEALETFDKRQ